MEGALVRGPIAQKLSRRFQVFTPLLIVDVSAV